MLLSQGPLNIFNGDSHHPLDIKDGPVMAGNEAEGVTVYPMEDGSLIHVLDYDKTIGVYIRHYKMAE